MQYQIYEYQIKEKVGYQTNNNIKSGILFHIWYSQQKQYRFIIQQDRLFIDKKTILSYIPANQHTTIMGNQELKTAFKKLLKLQQLNTTFTLNKQSANFKVDNNESPVYGNYLSLMNVFQLNTYLNKKLQNDICELVEICYGLYNDGIQLLGLETNSKNIYIDELELKHTETLKKCNELQILINEKSLLLKRQDLQTQKYKDQIQQLQTYEKSKDAIIEELQKNIKRYINKNVALKQQNTELISSNTKTHQYQTTDDFIQRQSIQQEIHSEESSFIIRQLSIEQEGSSNINVDAVTSIKQTLKGVTQKMISKLYTHSILCQTLNMFFILLQQFCVIYVNQSKTIVDKQHAVSNIMESDLSQLLYQIINNVYQYDLLFKYSNKKKLQSSLNNLIKIRNKYAHFKDITAGQLQMAIDDMSYVFSQFLLRPDLYSQEDRETLEKTFHSSKSVNDDTNSQDIQFISTLARENKDIYILQFIEDFINYFQFTKQLELIYFHGNLDFVVIACETSVNLPYVYQQS